MIRKKKKKCGVGEILSGDKGVWVGGCLGLML